MYLHSNIIGEGQPFIILHGFLGMGDNWKTLAKQFSGLDFQVHLVDQRNHGRSFHDSEFNYDMLAADLKAYCNHHNLQDIILLGHSMGGKTAMLFASLYPDIVSKLIVADISPRFYPVHHDAILEGLSSLNFGEITSRKEAEEQLSKYIQSKKKDKILLIQNKALELSLFLSIPASVALIVGLEWLSLRNLPAEVRASASCSGRRKGFVTQPFTPYKYSIAPSWSHRP